MYRVAVIGDSITYGQGIGEDERMTNVLEARLNEMGRRFEVLNFARPGAETRDHIAFLRDTALGLKPNFVLLQWFVNDVEGHDKSRRPIPRRLAPSDILHSILWQHSALYNVAQIAWINLQYATGFVEAYDVYMKKRFADPHAPASQAAAKALADFIEMTEEHGIPLGIMLYPDPSFWRSKQSPYQLAFLHEGVLETCTRYGITCLDLRATFTAVEDPRSLELSAFDNHPSARANQIMTEAVLAAFGETWAAARGGNSAK